MATHKEAFINFLNFFTQRGYPLLYTYRAAGPGMLFDCCYVEATDTSGGVKSFNAYFGSSDGRITGVRIEDIVDILSFIGVMPASSSGMGPSPLVINGQYKFHFDNTNFINNLEDTNQTIQPTQKSYIRSLPAIPENVDGTALRSLLNILQYAEDKYQTITDAKITNDVLEIDFYNAHLVYSFDNMGWIRTTKASLEMLFSDALQNNYSNLGYLVVKTDDTIYEFSFDNKDNLNSISMRSIGVPLPNASAMIPKLEIGSGGVGDTQPIKCTCNFNDLLRDGCKCGAFKKEMENRK